MDNIFRFGSQDSRDEDYCLVIDKPIHDVQACREIVEKYRPKDMNLICLDGGMVTWAFKGSADEVNNSILYTYYLHKSNTNPCPVLEYSDRNLDLKVSRAVRGILSMCSRTEHRISIKRALKSKSYSDKISALRLINFVELESKNSSKTKPVKLGFSFVDSFSLRPLEIIDITPTDIFNKNISTEEVYKFIAFQLIQTMMLVLGNEVYTKKDCVDLFPSFVNIIYSKKDKNSAGILQKYLNIFINYLDKNYSIRDDIYN